MLSFLRPAMPPKTRRNHLNPIPFENNTSSVHFHPPSTRSSAPDSFSMTHTIPPANQATKEPSMIQPPPHYHTSQTERFRVRSGTAHFYLGLGQGTIEPAVKVTTDSTTDDSTSQQIIHIPVRTQHHFTNPSPDHTLVVDVHLTPEDYQSSQKFFRNFFSYLDDCRLASTSPSVFQIMIFLHDSGTPIAVPVPGMSMLGGVGEVVSFGVSWGVTAALAAWGKYILGYEGSYHEYYTPEERRKGE